ncbi:hypothetical protein BD560DRAFT_491903 [Blakeslea trispora]|nr:hypothetical protein BD560DRAFT_491903 [Blakeslea trispora]
MSSIDDSGCLQAYFEQQNDTEAASIVAAVMALFPSHICTEETEAELEGAEAELESETQEEMQKHLWEQEQLEKYADELVLHVAALENDLLIKESEIAALKEVVFKWRNRVIEIESHYQHLELQYHHRLKLIEMGYQQDLNEKEDTITYLRDKVDYLTAAQQQYQESFESETNDTESSIYDREREQAWPSLADGQKELQSGTILGSIQNTMRAIEEELNFHALKAAAYEQQPNQQDHARQANFDFPSETVDTYSITTKSNKKKSFVHRMMKRAFPKLRQQNPKKRKASEYDSESNSPRSSIDQPSNIQAMSSVAGSNQSCQPSDLMQLSQNQSAVVSI